MSSIFCLKEKYEDINYAIESVLEIMPDHKNLYFVTLIPTDQNFVAGYLKNFDIKNCKRRLTRHLISCEISFAFGMIEFCTKEYQQGNDKIVRWAPHIHLVCPVAGEPKNTEALLKKYYRRSKYNNGRPVDIKPADELDRLVNYITKNPSERGRISRSFGFGKVISRHGRLPKIHRIELERYLCKSASPIFALGVMRRGDRWVSVTSKGRRW